MGKDGIVNVVACDTIGQQEIFIGYGGAIFETHDGALFVKLLHFSFVRLGVNGNDRHTSIQIDFERDIVTGTRFNRRVGGSSRWGICLRICIGGSGRDVTWGNNHRERPFISAIFVLKCFDVADRDANILARKDVGHLLREDVCLFLIEQAGNPSFLLGGAVNGLSFRAAQDLSFDDALSNHHRHIINSGSIRQRKHVYRFDLVWEVVLEFLGFCHSWKKTADLRFYVGVLQRTLAGWFAVFIESLKWPFSGRLVLLDRGGSNFLVRNHGNREDDGQGESS